MISICVLAETRTLDPLIKSQKKPVFINIPILSFSFKPFTVKGLSEIIFSNVCMKLLLKVVLYANCM
jgi:hypothetical protein